MLSKNWMKKIEVCYWGSFQRYYSKIEYTAQVINWIQMKTTNTFFYNIHMTEIFEQKLTNKVPLSLERYISENCLRKQKNIKYDAFQIITTHTRVININLYLVWVHSRFYFLTVITFY